MPADAALEVYFSHYHSDPLETELPVTEPPYLETRFSSHPTLGRRFRRHRLLFCQCTKAKKQFADRLLNWVITVDARLIVSDPPFSLGPELSVLSKQTTLWLCFPAHSDDLDSHHRESEIVANDSYRSRIDNGLGYAFLPMNTNDPHGLLQQCRIAERRFRKLLSSLRNSVDEWVQEEGVVTGRWSNLLSD